MNRTKLEKLRRQCYALRRTQSKAQELQTLAQKLERECVNRGKHPMWVSNVFPDLRALSIPEHKGRDIPVGTKNCILDQLEEDLSAWDEKLSREEGANGNGTRNSD